MDNSSPGGAPSTDSVPTRGGGVMRRRWATAFAVVALACPAGALFACSSNPSSPAAAPFTSPGASSPGSPQPHASSPPKAHASPQHTPAPSRSSPQQSSGAGVGDTQTLHGMDDGEVLDVTLTKVADPASPADEFSGPSGGNRLVATQFRIANMGAAQYDDAIGNDVTLVDSAGQTYDPSLSDVSAGQSFGG